MLNVVLGTLTQRCVLYSVAQAEDSLEGPVETAVATAPCRRVSGGAPRLEQRDNNRTVVRRATTFLVPPDTAVSEAQRIGLEGEPSYEIIGTRPPDVYDFLLSVDAEGYEG